MKRRTFLELLTAAVTSAFAGPLLPSLTLTPGIKSRGLDEPMPEPTGGEYLYMSGSDAYRVYFTDNTSVDVPGIEIARARRHGDASQVRAMLHRLWREQRQARLAL